MAQVVRPSSRPAPATARSLPAQLTLAIAIDRSNPARRQQSKEALAAQRAFQAATHILAKGFFGGAK